MNVSVFVFAALAAIVVFALVGGFLLRDAETIRSCLGLVIGGAVALALVVLLAYLAYLLLG